MKSSRACGEPEDHHREGLHTHLETCFLRTREKWGARRFTSSTKQHHEDVDGLFLRCSRRSPRNIRKSLRRAHCGQRLHAAGDESVSVRHPPHGKPVWRHSFDLCAAFVGGLGLVPVARTSGTDCALFEAVHARPRTLPGRTWPTLRLCVRSSLLMPTT